MGRGWGAGGDERGGGRGGGAGVKLGIVLHITLVSTLYQGLSFVYHIGVDFIPGALLHDSFFHILKSVWCTLSE